MLKDKLWTESSIIDQIQDIYRREKSSFKKKAFISIEMWKKSPTEGHDSDFLEKSIQLQTSSLVYKM